MTRFKRSFRGLTPKLLALTGCFIMIAELLIFWPSLGRYRATYMRGLMQDAQLSLAAWRYDDEAMALMQEEQIALLIEIGVLGITLERPDDLPHINISLPNMPPAETRIDLDHQSLWVHMRASIWECMSGDDRLAEVSSRVVPGAAQRLSILMDKGQMSRAMLDFGLRILVLSLMIAAITTGLLYLSIDRLLLRPIRRIERSMMLFQENPENAAHVITPSERGDEIGHTERALADMQDTLRTTLKHRERLAALGAAVAKINHDLRGILSTASLLSDRLAHSDDPKTREISPRLVKSIDRAIALCRQSLIYARSGNLKLAIEPTALHMLVRDLTEEFTPDLPEGAIILNDVPIDLVHALDGEQVLRVLRNLAANALKAGASEIKIEVAGENPLTLRFSDNGPGLSQAAREGLFQPFMAASGAESYGLGLSIAQEIMNAHGGGIELEKSNEGGTQFLLVFGAKDPAI